MEIWIFNKYDFTAGNTVLGARSTWSRLLTVLGMLWSSTSVVWQMLYQTPVARMWEWRMMTPDWQGYAVNGILTNLVNGRTVWESGIKLWKDYIITLHGLFSNIIGTLCKETLLSAMILVEHPPLVIFGKYSFVKEHGNGLKGFSFFFYLSL